MKNFTINKNNFLSQDINGFYRYDYTRGKWRIKDSIESHIVTLKNTFKNESDEKLNTAINKIKEILLVDLPLVANQTNIINPVIVVVPRAKTENSYIANQLAFKRTIASITSQLEGFIDGTEYILRHTNTFTTHLRHANIFNDGLTPAQHGPGITSATCHISRNVIDKNIILIDDLYTKSVNIDEDAIQALLNIGAKNVVFYAIGKTVEKKIIGTL